MSSKHTPVISTTVKTHYQSAQFINWLPKGSMWVTPEHPDVVLDYEPWSCANSNQRSYILAEIKEGLVELVLHVLNSEGKVVDVPYDPYLQYRVSHPGTVLATNATSKPNTSNQIVDRLVADAKSHTVVAGVSPEAARLGLQVAPMTSPAGTVEPPTGTPSSYDSADKLLKEEKQAAAEPEAEKPEEPCEKEPAEKDAHDDDKKKFAELVDGHKWKDAYDLLVAVFGDQVTFNYRTVMSMKDWDAIVEKYGLK